MMVRGDDRIVHIIASPFKTGTSSIAQALVTLGVARAPMPYNRRLLQRHRPDIRDLNRLARTFDTFLGFEAAYGDDVRERLGRISRAARRFDVFHDAPLGHSHLHPFALKALFPEARMIWVKRPKPAWLDSVEKWELARPKVYATTAQWRDDPLGLRQKRILTRKRARRNFTAIKRCFPQDCLVLEWSDLASFEALAAFYGVPPPMAAFPHANPSPRA